MPKTKPGAKAPAKHKADGDIAPPAKKAKGAAAAAAAPAPPAPAAAAAAGPCGDDPLLLKPLFAGSGHGAKWEGILAPTIAAQPEAARYIGPGRDPKMVPIRELTFQALKPNPPGGWRVVSLGQSPYPRMESATGIAHFDSQIAGWEDKRFGVVVSMRCLIKAAAMHKYGKPKTMKQDELRKLLKEKNVVGPAEWFQAMLAQGVLFMNAALTITPPEDKTQRASNVVQEHTQFWKPVVERVVDAILTERGARGEGVVFAWWGGESLKTKKFLEKCFARHPKVPVEHVMHKNPAAMYDSFCDPPGVFSELNAALGRLKLGSVDWLPSVGWQKGLTGAAAAAGGGDEAHAARMGAFIKETQDLHKMYLERLKDGLGDRKDSLGEITGVMSLPLLPLPDAVDPVKLRAAAGASVAKAGAMKRGPLTVDEAAAVHMYTTNTLYRGLNAALRDADRKAVQVYLKYLRLFLTALRKLPLSDAKLYRGVGLDLSAQYQLGAEVTWWAVSSCTPKLSVAKAFTGAGKASTLFVITPRRSVAIRHLSAYTHEEEYILPPGTQFRVSEVKKIKPGHHEVYLEELDRPQRVG